MSRMVIGADVFESECDLVEVTSSHRPDTAWSVVDAAGHEHRWYIAGGEFPVPAGAYTPEKKHLLPTLVWVKTGVAYYEDGEPYDVGEHRCVFCGEAVVPGYTADTTRQFVPGLRSFRINGHLVSEEEFRRRVELLCNGEA